MYVFIRSCIALTRGVVKIIQTDPDSFFSSQSGTLSSIAAPTYHLAPSPPSSVAPSSFLSLSLFLSALSCSRCLLLHRRRLSLPPRVPVILSSYCPDAEFEIAPDDLVALCISFASRTIRGLRASLMITGYNREIGTEIEEDACQSL